jgi:hypothetical protein
MAMADRKDTADDRLLDLMFSSARTSAPEPDLSFLSRLEADMEAMRPKSEKPTTDWHGARTIPWFQRIFAASGLTGAAALGVWIGFVMPETLNDVAETFVIDDAVGIEAFLPSADFAALDE